MHPSISCLGIDPGLESMGYAHILFENRELSLLQHGMVQTPKTAHDATRLRYLFLILNKMGKEFNPTMAQAETYFAVERKKKGRFTKKGDPVFGHDPNAQRMNYVVGVTLAALAQYNIELYSPVEMKAGIANNGHADKAMVQEAVRGLLKMEEILDPDHIADAAGHAILRILRTEIYQRSGATCHLPLFRT